MVNLEEDVLYKNLCLLKQNALFLLGKKSLRQLDGYIIGFLDALDQSGESDHTREWFSEFRDYIARHCEVQKNPFCISEMLFDNGYDDCSGVDRFLVLLEGFAKEYYHVQEPPLPPAELLPGEARVFRISPTWTRELAVKYITDHEDEFFGLSQAGGDTAFYFTPLNGTDLFCSVYRAADASVNYIEKLDGIAQELETFESPIGKQITPAVVFFSE